MSSKFLISLLTLMCTYFHIGYKITAYELLLIKGTTQPTGKENCSQSGKNELLTSLA